jgi:hypothetical protein
MTRAAQTRCHFSKHERQQQARAEALSRRSSAESRVPSPVKLGPEDVELIDRLVRGDRTAVSTALLAIAGIGAGERRRKAVLACSPGSPKQHPGLGPRARSAARGAEQIARHVRRALSRVRPAVTV